MKRSAPTPVHPTAQTDAPSLSFGVIRTALIGMSLVIVLLLGLLCFFRTRTHHIAVPTTTHAPLLRMASALSSAHHTR
jgi:hypothetical protein